MYSDKQTNNQTFVADLLTQVTPGPNLYHSETIKQGNVETLFCTLLSDGSPHTLLELTPLTVAGEQFHRETHPFQGPSGFQEVLPAATLCTVPDIDAEPLMASASPMAMNDTTPPRTAKEISSDAYCRDLLALFGHETPDGPLSHRAPASPSSAPSSRAHTPSIEDPTFHDECFHSGVQDEGRLDPCRHGSIQDGGSRKGIAGVPDASSKARLQGQPPPSVTELGAPVEKWYQQHFETIRTVSATGSNRVTVPVQQHSTQVCCLITVSVRLPKAALLVSNTAAWSAALLIFQPRA